jgi:N-acetylglucosaminyl-diphospho-decaprenol L-rhamnosyltransferase
MPESVVPNLVSVIIVSYNTRHLLDRMFRCLKAGAIHTQLQVIAVDNASRDGSADHLAEHYPEVELIRNQANVGFGRANNQALPLVRGEYVLLLNTDAFVEPGAIDHTVAVLRRDPKVGVLGARLVGDDGAFQPSCRYFPTVMNEFVSQTGLVRFFPWVKPIDDFGWDHRSDRECDWVPGCYYLMPRAVVDQVGLFDPRYFVYYEEVDHCRAVKAAGWKVMYTPVTTVIHVGGESAKQDAEITAAGRQNSAMQVESALLYHRKHAGLPGVWANLALAWVGAAVLSLKSLVKGHGIEPIGVYLKQARLVTSLFGRTAWGSEPTR